MRSRTVALLSVAALAVLITAVRVLRAPASFVYPDAFYYAEMGRQLARGEGFSSLQGYPYLFSWLGEHGLPLLPPWPNVSRFPLVTVVYAVAFALGGATDTTVKVVGGCFFVATAIGLHLLGARLFRPAVGVLAAILFVTNIQHLGLALSGLLETGAAFFLVASTLALVVVAERHRRRAAAGLGVLLGLAFLWRYDLLVLLPAAAAALWLRRGRGGWRPVAWTMLGFVFVVGPWIVRSLWLFDTPLAMLAIDRNLLHGVGRADPYGTTQAVEAYALLTDPAFLREKAAALVWPLTHWRVLFGAHLAWLGPAMLAAGPFFRLRRHRAATAWLFVALAWLLRAVLLSLMHHESRFYQSFAAVCLPLAVGGAALFVGLLPRRVRPAVALAGVALCLFPAVRVAPWTARRARARPAQQIRMYQRITEHTRPGAVVAAWKQPEMVAWYGDRFVVNAPPQKLRALWSLGVTVDAVLYPTRQARWVQRTLAAQRLGRFIPVPVGAEQTLWVRPDAAAPDTTAPPLTPTRAHRAAAGPHRTRPVQAAHAPAAPAADAPRLVVLYAPCSVNASHLAPYAPDVFYTPALAAFARESAVFERHQTEADQSGVAYAALFSGRGSAEDGVFSHPVRLAGRVTLITEAFADAGWDVFFWAHHGMASPRLGYGQGVPAANVVRGHPLAGDDERFGEILRHVAADPGYRALVVTNFTVSHWPYRDRLAALRRKFPTETARLTAGLSAEDRRWAKRTYTFRLDLQKDFPRLRRELDLTPARLAVLSRTIEALYVSDIAHLDDLFGSTVRAIDDAGLRDESLVVFTADHGEVLYRDNALFPWSHDFQLAPEVLRVPLLVRGAGVLPYRVQEVTRSIDVFPTIAALAGVPVHDPGVRGVSLAAPLRGTEPFPVLTAYSHTPKLRSTLVQKAQRQWHTFTRYFPSASIAHIWVSLRAGDLVAKWRREGDGRFDFELFDLATDPEERRNLYRRTDPVHRALAEDLAQYKKTLLAAYAAAEKRAPTPEVDRGQLERLRKLGYVE